ncbi:MAG TPA: hypothetical protein VGM92_01095 [Candidatus Kapabacteria bacterium]|jgi:predicted transcriptional regulator
MPVKQAPRPKETALKAIKHLKDTASYEDMMYELYVLQKIQRGREAARRGKVVSHESAQEHLGKWLK